MRRFLNPLALALLAAFLAVADGRAATVTYTIDVEYGGPGTVTPSGPVEVPAGGSQTFTFTPSGCYSVDEVSVDEVAVGFGITEYTFTNVQADHVLFVSFGPRLTTTALDVRPAFGQCAVPETLTATVANADGGQVQFFLGANLLATRTLASGTATYIVASGLGVGSYTFSASYVGTSCSAASNSPAVAYDVAATGPTPVTQTLTLSSSNVLLHGVVNASTTLWFGGSVASGQAGQVTYYDGATALATVAMAGGHSSRFFQIDTPGIHVLTAVAQLSQCVPITVASEPETALVQERDKTITFTSLLISPSPVDVGGSVELRAVVDRPNATGFIHFLDVTNGVEVGSVFTDNSMASFTYGPLSGSSRTMLARYDGDAGYQGSVSNQASLQIGPIPPPPPPPPLFSPPFLSCGTGLDPFSMAVGDLNADGRPDLAAANVSTATVSVLLGNGPGVFVPSAAYSTGSYPSSVAIADLNADGRPDLAVAGSRMSVLLGAGDGTFGPTADVGTGGNSVAVADLDADGKPDLAVADWYGYKVSVMLGNGDGTFRPKTDFGTGLYPSSVAIADVNGDGKPDLVVADAGPITFDGFGRPTDGGEVSVLLGNGDGTFAPRSAFRTGQDPYSVAIADLNADGRLDLATANRGQNGAGNTVSVLLGNGDGTFGPKTDFGTPVSPNSIAIADLSGDGRPDLAVATNSSTSSNAVSVLVGNGDGTFGPRTDFGAGFYYSVAIADLNADGLPDLALADVNANAVTVLLHTPDVATATLLAQFDATSDPDGIQLRWSFGDASRVSSATVERGPAAVGPWAPITPELRHDGNSTAALDRTTDTGSTYFYRLNVKLVDGSNVTFGPISSTASAAISESSVSLLGANPARGASQIQYAVARAGRVRLEVADVAGRVVTTLFDGVQSPGRFHVAWDGTNGGERLPAGLYFVRLRTLDRIITRKLTMLP